MAKYMTSPLKSQPGHVEVLDIVGIVGFRSFRLWDSSWDVSSDRLEGGSAGAGCMLSRSCGDG